MKESNWTDEIIIKKAEAGFGNKSFFNVKFEALAATRQSRRPSL